MTLKRIVDLLSVWRLREVISGLIPILLASLDQNRINFPILAMVCLGYFLIIESSFLINEYSDSFDTDILSHKEKGIITSKSSRKFTLISFIIVSVLGLLIMWKIGLFAVGLISFILLTLYSVPPVRFKSRPFLDLIVVTLCYAVLPYLSYLSIIHAPISEVTVIILLFFASGFIAIDLVTEGSDIDADKNSGIATSAVFFGHKTNLTMIRLFSFASLVLGIFAMVLSFHWWYILLVINMFLLFTAGNYGLSLLKNQARLEELYTVGVKFGIISANLLIIVLAILVGIKIIFIPNA